MNYLFGIIPTPTPMESRSLVYDLKTRLDWGEPGLTIVDVRDRHLFNQSHITGAISLPLSELVNRALNSLPLNRDIYIYSDTDEEAAEAANLLRDVGYRQVSELRGGLGAWKAVGFPVEAICLAGN